MALTIDPLIDKGTGPPAAPPAAAGVDGHDALAARPYPDSHRTRPPTRRTLLPQAIRSVLPNAADEIVSLLKDTSIVSATAVGELFHQVHVVCRRDGRALSLLMAARVRHIFLTTALSVLQHYAERHCAKGAAR